MSDKDDLTTPKDGDSELVRRLREELEARNTDLTKANSELTTVKKETAFRAAGLDPKRGPGALLFKAYDGDFSEDSVIAAAEEYGINPVAQKQEPADEQQVPTEEQQTNRNIDNATSGATSTGASAPDPEQLGRQAYEETFARTGNKETAAAAHFEAKMQAAVEAAKKSKAS